MGGGILFEAVVFGLAGLGLEVVYTGLTGLRSAPAQRRRYLMGYSSLWYVPLYALAPSVLDVSHRRLFALPWVARGLIYMVAIWAAEYLSMGLLHLLLGQSPSEESYRKSRWNVHGFTRLDHGPAYSLAGLILEWMFRSMQGL